MTMPTTEEMLARLREAQRASAFVQENLDYLMQTYPDQSIAVRDDAVVAAGKDSHQLTEHILAAGFEPAEVWTFFIPAEPRRLLL